MTTTPNDRIAARLRRLGLTNATPDDTLTAAEFSGIDMTLDALSPPPPPIFAPYYPRLKRMVESGRHVILTGPAATGKTTAVRQLAAECGAELYIQQCYRSLGIEDIRGTRGLYSGMTVFEPGRLTQSLEDPHGWYFLDEANMADPAILSLLNNLLDGSGEMAIPEDRRKIVRPPSWRFFAACNLGYQGTQELNQALVSRCAVIECEGFSPDVEAEMLRREYPALGDMADVIVLIAIAVRESRQSGLHEFDFCLRTMQQLAEEVLVSGDLLEAFRLTVLPKVGDSLTFGPVRDGLMKAVELVM